jgi:D-alanyl-lipoteichoic acid acyltransferase DltB (MBOAT superfamily)
MGFELTLNFERPFFAASPRELWKRWHISLSRWLRDYLYIPLGGNQNNHTTRNLLLTMLLGGLWHGANWTFLLWGALHGGALALEHRLGWFSKHRILGIFATFHLTVFGFVIFRAHSISQAAVLISRMIGPPYQGPDDGHLSRQLLITVLPLLLVEFFQEQSKNDELLASLPKPVQAGLMAALVLVTAFLGATFSQEFIYFQF